MSDGPDSTRAGADAAFATARELGQVFASTAVARDRAGGTAKRERDLLRGSGLLGFSVPRELGGGGGAWADTMQLVRLLANADGSLAHLFGFHHLLLATVRLFGSREQWTRHYREAAERRAFWGNALNPLDTRTTIRRAADGGWLVSGSKSFCSGASDADTLIVSALDENRKLVVAAVPGGRAGIRVNDDWDNMGQRQTDSGSVDFTDLRVADDEILRTPGPLGSVFASLRPCIAQLVLVNVYLGLGEGALAEGRRFVTGQARAWPASGVARATDDPYVLRTAGELQVGLQGAAALADIAGRALDGAWERGDALSAAARGGCALAVATAKVAATRAGLEAASRLFEISGARATTAAAGLDRFWRNLRTHTLHDPVDYKLREIGRWVLLDEVPVPSFYS